ncbi:MAG: poly-gamma-glutamate synthase PgsB [Tissierellales bacterium]|nr:poly-gamma-glutamate synthase PgsB [Tissierellales bacterium]MBN2828625.1 poly-gamma-glutamate synthase PgsB [Tissierellales bacterium]
MLFLSLSLFAIYLLYLIYEYTHNEHLKKSFSNIILVNGIRGKTSTALQIDSLLRENGFRVFTKTTGDEPVILDCNHNRSIIKRKGQANINEQLSVIKKAHAQKAQILIIECMAIDPDLQHVLQHRIVKSDRLVMTNIRPDHIPEMGKNLDEIAYALSRTIPANGFVYTADCRYLDSFQVIANQRNAKLCYVEDAEFNTYKLAHKLCEDLILEHHPNQRIESTYFNPVESKKYIIKNGQNKNITFVNLFSVNDPVSTKYWIDYYLSESNHYIHKYLVYNNRADRLGRIRLYSDTHDIFNLFDKLFICGENTYLAHKIFIKSFSIEIVREKNLSFLHDLEENSIIFGIGNIKGEAYAFIEGLNSGDTHE